MNIIQKIRLFVQSLGVENLFKFIKHSIND
jgi:hypothetical protein